MDFDEIPVDWLEPSTLLEIKANYRNIGVLAYPTKAIIIAPKLATGSLAAGQITEITRPEEAVPLFGLGSIGAEMVAAFRYANKNSPLFVMGQPDAAGAVKASGTLTFAGTVSGAMVLRFLIAGRQIRITALATDTAANFATKLAAAINADTANTVTAAAAGAVVTCTARNGGEVGNDIDLRIDSDVQPLPATLAVTIVAMANGAGNPVLQTALDLLANAWFTDVVTPYNDPTNLAAFVEWLRVRFTATKKLDVHGYVAKRGTYGQLTTFGDLTNSKNLSPMGLKASPSSSWNLAAAVAGLACFHLTNDPARQLKSLVVPGIMAPIPADQFTDEEQNLLLAHGVSTFNHLDDGSTTISRIVTSYKTSSLGVPDSAWRDIMTVKTLSRIRFDWAGYITLLYPRAKMVEDGDAGSDQWDTTQDENGEDQGSAVVTPGRMHGSWAARCKLYAGKVWITDVKKTVAQSVFQISPDDRNRMESRQQLKIVGNLMVLAGSLEFQP